ncbi:MAG: hypothetical protein O7C98_06560 [Planctomycetota bacterium]|nr:hypothetical protein [Planctomycetota bacterium]
MQKQRGLFLFVFALALTGCHGSGSGGLIKEVKDPKISQRELRMRMIEYVRHWTAVVEIAADEIGFKSDDTTLRRNAIRWKMDAVGACQTAALRDDPVAALMDTFALAAQHTQYFETGVGSNLFGPYQGIAVAAAKELEAEIEQVAFEFTDGERGKRLVYEWVDQNPIRGSLLNRPTTGPVLARHASSVRRSPFATLQRVEERIANGLERLDLYIEAAPHQARWQAEYVIEQQLLTREEKNATLRQVASMSASLEQLSKLQTDLPELVAAEREKLTELVQSERQEIGRLVDEQRVATLDALKVERETIFEEVDSQRLATLDTLEKEREAVFDQIRKEREAVLEALREERRIILDAVDEQRRAVMADVDRLATKAIDESVGRGMDMIDSVFRRGALFGGGGLVLLFCLGLAFVRLTRKRG